MALVVDTSVFVAIYRGEPGSESLREILASIVHALVPASCLVEASLLRRLGQDFLPWLENFIDDTSFEIAPVTLDSTRAAMQAAKLYGKGSRHPARLNFGDCLSFGVASARDLPLLFPGEDFGKTPIRSALSRKAD